MQASENWFGANLRETRKNKGITVRQLADDSGVSEATVKNTESGKSVPGADIVSYFAKALGCSVGALCGEQKKDARAFLVGLRAEIDDFLTT